MLAFRFSAFEVIKPQSMFREAKFVQRVIPQVAILLLWAVSLRPDPALGQIPGPRPAGIQQQIETFTVSPAKVKPGDILNFKYTVTSDLKTPRTFFSPRVRLTIRNLAGVEKSLDPGSFTPGASYRLKPGAGRINELFAYTIHGADSVVYRLPDFKADSTVAPDTLVFEFAYRVPTTLAVTCGLRLAGVDEELSAIEDPTTDSTRVFYGLRSAYSEIETESKIEWSFRLEPSLLQYQAEDQVDLFINYKNTGNVKDVLKFVVTLPAMLKTSDTLFVRYNAFAADVKIVRQETNERQIVFSDPNVFAGQPDGEIQIRFKFRITSADRAASNFVVQLVPRCAPPDRGDKDFQVALTDLVRVTKSASPALVAPGETIFYTITVQRVKPPDVALDSVFVLDKLDPGISEIIFDTPPLFDRIANDTLRWLLQNFTEDQREIKFRAIVRPDYYPRIVSDPQRACVENSLSNYVRAVPQQNQATELKEQVVGNNSARVAVRIQPLGDVLQINRVTMQDRNGPAQILPGDTLRFAVVFENVSRFAPSQWFSVCDTLPARDYLEAPFDISPPRAQYVPGANLLRLDSLQLTPGKIDSLVFYVRVRDDARICSDVTLRNIALIKLLDALDCGLANNALTSTLTLANPQTATTLALANLNRIVNRDQPADFTINFNSGTSLIPVRDVTITATLAAGMEFVSSDLTPTINGQTLTWSGLTIQPNENRAIRVTVIPHAAQPCVGDTLPAQVTIASNPLVCSPAAPQSGALILPGTDDLLDLSLTATPDNTTPLDASTAPALTYTLTITNNGQFDAEELLLTNIVPDAKNFMLLSASGGGVIDTQRGVVTWTIARLNVGASAQFTVQGSVSNRLYCAPDSLVNTTVLVATRLPLCVPERRVTKHVIAPTRVEIQPAVTITEVALKNEGRTDNAVEPNEPATVCLKLRAGAAVSNLSLRSSTPNFNGWTASFGNDVVELLPEAGNPTALAAGEEREFCFRVQGPATISVTSASVRGVLVSDQNCGQNLGPTTFPAKGLPLLKLTLSLKDSSENNLARDQEQLTATATLQHEPNSGFVAEAVTLHLALRAEAPANIVMISAYDANNIKLDVAQLAPNAPALDWPVKFRYPVLTTQNERIVATAYYSYFGFNRAGVLAEMNSAEVIAAMAVEHLCYARPRTFIPAQHHAGMRFQPDDGQTVSIFDAAGNKIWNGTTNAIWRGDDYNGKPVVPGTYVFVISGEGGCKGTIVVLR